ncbi:proline--tRNA ligase [Paramaledivibacter caminithermalis]|uniref:Prolyl-tRNA synthetase n=1 Tax=Paramaledivibacter caminithermalis (strain DSM 15212 / CIP 107654 / DViRD3) TaxID=1121301 RepID=A0A1M6TLB0_PARC5|nr:YbaK/EbsC family protein [Paramaledivibacter caminithermalis]SHK57693.1 prolyl-tRNA synthetase [Paramaledivibacter caminithermalis DSM 15212]
MRMTKLTGKTLKNIEDEFNIESQKLLLRSAMFRNISPGVYSVLPFGIRAINKLLDLLSDQLEREGFQRVYIPSDIEFEKSVSLSLRNDMKSYKDLPKTIYDIFSSGREKIKIKDGLLRSKDFTTFRTCSFYENEELLLQGYENIIDFYKSKFCEMGLDIFSLKSYNEKNPADKADELIFTCGAGDRTIYSCDKCEFRTLEEVADFYVQQYETDDKEIEAVHTPDIKTIKELENFMNIKAENLAKTLLVKAGGEIVAVVIRGNRELNPYKLSSILNVPIRDINMAEYEEIDGNIETVPGFVGPVELEGVRIIVDKEITSVGALVTGANKKDYHLKNVKYGRDFVGDLIAEVSYIMDNDKCPVCGGSLDKEYGIDLGKILSLGKITDVKNLQYKDKEGKSKGIYGASSYIDIYKLLSIIVEKHHDEDGIIWPIKVAPYHVIISILNTKKEEQVKLGENIYRELKSRNIDVILDDRKERAGAKFYDADLLGIPIRIVVARGASENKVEFKLRWKNEKEELDVNEAIEKVLKLLKIY